MFEWIWVGALAIYVLVQSLSLTVVTHLVNGVHVNDSNMALAFIDYKSNRKKNTLTINKKINKMIWNDDKDDVMIRHK